MFLNLDILESKLNYIYLIDLFFSARYFKNSDFEVLVYSNAMDG